MRVKLVILSAEVEVGHRSQRGPHDQQEGDGVDHGGAAVSHLEVEIDWKCCFRSHQKQGRVEVFEGHEKGHWEKGSDLDMGHFSSRWPMRTRQFLGEWEFVPLPYALR